jgi:uncharacterized protein (DUF1778 family)
MKSEICKFRTTKKEKDLLTKNAKLHGYASLSEFIRKTMFSITFKI